MKFKSTIDTFIYVWKYCRTWLILTIISVILIGLIPFFTLVLTQKITNEVLVLIRDKSGHYDQIILLLSLQFLLALVQSLIFNLRSIIDKKVEIDMDLIVGREVAQKAASVPYAYFELPEFYHHHDRLKGQFGNLVISPVKNILELCQSFISLFSYVGFLFMIHWSLLFLSFLMAIPILIVKSKYGSQKFFLMKFQTPIAREANYSKALLHHRPAAKEIRLFNLKQFLLMRWEVLYRQNSKEILDLAKKETKATITLDIFTAFFYGLSGLFVINLIDVTKFSVGSFVSSISALQGAQGTFNLISSQIAILYEQNFYIEDLFTFMNFKNEKILNLENKKTENFPSQLRKGINIHNFSYCYPGNNDKVLKNISLSIKPGEKIAIVGENGSGKTTLVQCLIGLYFSSDGTIYFDDTDIRSIKQHQIWSNITAIFQDFMRYSYSIKDNITFGNVERYSDTQFLEEVSKRSGIKSLIMKLDKGYETKLGKIFGGIDLSGGQWQRIALARALYRDSQVIILDEPTAALDPIAELEVYNLIKEITNDRTTIFISHRMAVTNIVDRIFVMKDGRIIEEGNHSELMDLKGEYYNMYTSQTSLYDLIEV